MLLQPKKSKFRKVKKRYLRNQLLETRSNKLRFGTLGIQVLESFRFSARQIESLRQCVNRDLKRKGKMWITVFPSISVTNKPTENRMGKGKGSVDFWVAPVKAGTVIIELSGVSYSKGYIALRKGINKLPIKSHIITRIDVK